MAKQVVKVLKLQAPGGAATPAPPIGPALGQVGVNIGQFVQQFNDRTKDMRGTICPVELTVYKDKSFDFVIKSPPAASLILKAAGVEKGSGVPHTDKVGKISRDQVREIAQTKLEDLNAFDIDSAEHIIAGTARSMGIDVED